MRASVSKTHGPSYISPRAFSAFILDAVEHGNDEVTKFQTASGQVKELPDVVKRRLDPLLRTAGGDLETYRKSIEAWFDDSMARVSGWYKRKAQVILIVIGACMVVALNADTLSIGERLWTDQTVRAAIVQQANQQQTQPDGTTPQERLKNAADDVAGVANLGVPLGWSGAAKPQWSDTAWITTIAGWLITILAISLGAPFWFDTLGRLSRLRSSGKPETPLPATGSGKPNERVVTEVPPATVSLQVSSEPPSNGAPPVVTQAQPPS
jgi:hypothetical protein